MTDTLRANSIASPRETVVAPFAGWMVHPDWAGRVISRAYDNLTPEQRRALVSGNPYSYMNVTRSREDIAGNANLSMGELVALGAGSLSRLLMARVFVPTGRPALYLYRMTRKQDTQTGVVGTVPVQGFNDGRIRIHERVKDDRADLLAAHLMGVGATSSPVTMTIRSSSQLEKKLFEITSTTPADLEFGSTLVRHEIWTVPEAHSSSLVEALAGQTLYVADGHHRSAAAVRALAAEPDNPELARTLAVVFPDQQLQVQAFHRLAVDQHSRSTQDCLAALADAAEVTPVSGSSGARPRQKGMAGMYLGGSWHRLELPEVRDSRSLGKLDVERLRQTIIGPVLDAEESGNPKAVDYLPASAGLDELARRCDAENRVGFVLHPPTVRDLMAVADEGGLMPPKSSFFAPKPRSGVFLRVLGRGATAHLPPS